VVPIQSELPEKVFKGMRAEEIDEDNEFERRIKRLERGKAHYKAGYLIYKKRFQSVIIFICVPALVCILGLLLVTWNLVSDRTQLVNDNRALLRRVVVLDEQVEEIASQLLESTQPGLLKIEFDKLVPLNESYVKAIELSKHIGLNGLIGYQVLLENHQPTDLIPEIWIQLHDLRGSLLVSHPLDLDQLTPITAGNSLSVSGRFDRPHPEAAFFKLFAN
jgi:hypothetical protein